MLSKKRVENIEERLTKTLSRIFKIDAKYFLKGGFWLSLSHLSYFVKGFILSILFANFLSKEVYGQYNFILSMLSIAAVFALPGLKSSLVQALSRNRDGEYLHMLKKTFFWGLLGSLFLLCVAFYGHYVGRSYGMIIFFFLALIFPLYNCSQYYKMFYTGKEKFRTFSFYTSISNLLSALFIAISLLLHLDLFWIIATTVLAQIIVEGYFTFFKAPKELTNTKKDKENYEYGKKISFSLGLTIFADQLKNIIIILFLGFESLAIYALISLLPNQIKAGFTALVTPMLIPKFSKVVVERKTFLKQIALVFFFSILLAGVYALLAPYFFGIFYAPYKDYVLLSIYFSISIPFILTYGIIEEYFKAKLKDDINYVHRVTPFIDIAITLFLVHSAGLLGIVFSRIIYRFLLLVYGLLLLFRK